MIFLKVTNASQKSYKILTSFKLKKVFLLQVKN